METLTIREVAAMLYGMAMVNQAVHVGFIASSNESARLTGYAVAELLKPQGVTWSAAYQQVRWPSGSTATFLSARSPERMRGQSWTSAFVAAAISQDPDVHEALFPCVWRSGGTGTVRVAAEVVSRGDLTELLRAAA